MTDQERIAREWLEQMIVRGNNERGEGGLSAASKMLGISSGVLSQLRNNKYPGNSDNKWEQIYAHAIAKQEAAATYKMGGYAPTSVSEKILSYMRYCHVRGGVMAITGDAGIGKTMAIRQYQKQYPDNVVVITMRNGYRSIKTGLMMLAKAMGIKEKGKNIYTLDEDISARLRDNMLIIIDEAQHCSLKMIDHLRSFPDEFDGTGKTLGMVFLGNKTTADKFGGSQDSELGQISSRAIVNMSYGVEDVTIEDMRMLFADLEDEASLELMHGLTQGAQGIRGAMRVYEVAMDNQNISYDGLVAAARHKGMGIA